MLQNGNNIVASIVKMAVSRATSAIGRNTPYDVIVIIIVSLIQLIITICSTEWIVEHRFSLNTRLFQSG